MSNPDPDRAVLWMFREGVARWGLDVGRSTYKVGELPLLTGLNSGRRR